MAAEELGTEVVCPYCGETISVLVDTSVSSQTYIEDCSVCCRPIQFSAQCEDETILRLDAFRST